jgi:hypothetical protein
VWYLRTWQQTGTDAPAIGLSLDKISKDGTVLETVETAFAGEKPTREDFPAEIDPADDNYRIYYRQR